jgi:hypothetical protein
MSFRTETIHGIDNIVHIALLTYTGDVIYIEPHIFKSYCTTAYNGSDNNSDLGCGGNEYTAYNSYFIANDSNEHKNNVAFTELTNSSNTLKSFLGEGVSFTTESGASHNKGSRYNGCTQFYNLRTLNDNFLINKKFNAFSGVAQYLSWARSNTWDWYWRVYYRKVDDFMEYKNCSSNNLSIDNYINNNFLCKDYVNNGRLKYLSNLCINKSVSDDQLLNICQPLLLSDAIDTSDKSNINKKLLNYCSQSDRLINDSNCKKFWNTDYNSYYKQSDKLNYLDSAARSLCGNGHNNYPFCNCINNQKEQLTYINSKGETQKIDDSCLSIYCNEKSYKLSDHKEKLCPNVCIQTVYGAYSTIKDVQQKCEINTGSNPSQPPGGSNPLGSNPGGSNPSGSNPVVPVTVEKTGLFGLKNEKIQLFMAKLKIEFPVETPNYLLTEEDMFILLFCLLCMFILLVSYATTKSNKRREEYDDEDDSPQYNPQYNLQYN